MSSQYIKELEQAVANASSAFECSGSLELDGPLTLFAKVPATEDRSAAFVSLEFPMAEPDEILLLTLLDACVPASFGRGQDSVLDPAYRQALVLPTKIVAVHAPEFNLAPIFEVVRDTLVGFGPEDNKVVTARFDILNVYGPGGFFKAHADTPRSKEMFASLVLALPCAHTGGELVLWDHTPATGDKEVGVNEKVYGDLMDKTNKIDGARVFSWGDSKDISWVAFLSDRIHEVVPVGRGYRITLTYNLFVDNRRINLQPTADGHQISASLQEKLLLHDQPTVKHPIFDALIHILSSPDCFPEGTDIGIYLVNRYIFEFENKANSVLQNLRGSDFFVHRALLALNLEFTVHFIGIFDGYEDSALLSEQTTGAALADRFFDCYPEGLIYEDHAEWLSETDIQVVNKWKRHATFFWQGQYGNDPGSGYFYGSVMFRIKIPSAEDRMHGTGGVAALNV